MNNLIFELDELNCNCIPNNSALHSNDQILSTRLKQPEHAAQLDLLSSNKFAKSISLHKESSNKKEKKSLKKLRPQSNLQKDVENFQQIINLDQVNKFKGEHSNHQQEIDFEKAKFNLKQDLRIKLDGQRRYNMREEPKFTSEKVISNQPDMRPEFRHQSRVNFMYERHQMPEQFENVGTFKHVPTVQSFHHESPFLPTNHHNSRLRILKHQSAPEAQIHSNQFQKVRSKQFQSFEFIQAFSKPNQELYYSDKTANIQNKKSKSKQHDDKIVNSSEQVNLKIEGFEKIVNRPSIENGNKISLSHRSNAHHTKLNLREALNFKKIDKEMFGRFAESDAGSESPPSVVLGKGFDRNYLDFFEQDHHCEAEGERGETFATKSTNTTTKISQISKGRQDLYGNHMEGPCLRRERNNLNGQMSSQHEHIAFGNYPHHLKSYQNFPPPSNHY